jgi:hypothetical protein
MNHGFPKSLARRRADYFAIGEISPASTLRWNAKVLRTGGEASITEPPRAATTLDRVHAWRSCLFLWRTPSA